MTPHDARWETVSALFERALALPHDARASFVDAACPDDAALRDEVLSLLQAHGVSPDWMEPLGRSLVPAALAAARALPDERAHEGGDASRDPRAAPIVHPGDRVLHYEVLERLGQGGAGVVHRARDLRLGRDVALKFVRPELLDDPEARRRLAREARAASTLDHPHICTIYGLEEAPDGRLLIAMACCERGTLRDRLREGSLDVAEAVAVASGIADALAWAHARGVVHRDLKPANVGLSSDGRVRLLDFGIAKVRRSGDETSGAGVSGTLPYLAPERIRGATADPRADVWALGVTLYEMLAGCRPFEGDDDAALLYAVLEREPVALERYRPDLAPELAALVRQLLRKDPAERPADGSAVLAALAALAPMRQEDATTMRSGRAASASRVAWRRRAVTLLVLGLAGSAAVALARREGGDATAAGAGAGGAPVVAPAVAQVPVAVLPFAVRGDSSLAYLRDGMVDLLATALDGVGDWRGIDPNTVLGAMRREAGRVPGPEEGRRIAAALGARRFVLGSVVQLGDRMQLAATLYDGEGSERARASIVVPADSLVVGVDHLTRTLAGRELARPAQRLSGLATATTRSLPALRAYLEGERLLRDARAELAIGRFREAVVHDSTFALAWYRLARAAGWRGVDSLNVEATERARRYSASLPPRARAIVEAYHAVRTGAPREAERLVRRVVSTYPDDVEGWLLLGELHYHDGPHAGRPTTDAREPLERVMALDPMQREVTVHLMDLAARERRVPALDTLFQMYFSPNSEGERLEIRQTYLTLHARVAGDGTTSARALEALGEAGPDAVREAIERAAPQVGDLDFTASLANQLMGLGTSKDDRQQAQRQLARVALARGRWSAAESAWRAMPDADAPLQDRALALAMPFAPAPAETLRALRARVAAGDAARLLPGAALDPGEAETVREYLQGILDVRLGDAPALARVRRRLLARAAAGGDRLAAPLQASLLGLDAWRQGRAAEALRALEEGVIALPFAVRATAPALEQHLERFVRAEALLALGRDSEAARWYHALNDGYGTAGLPYLVPATIRLGEIAERSGQTAEARRRYTTADSLWTTADAALAARRRALGARLAALPR